ncbi:preprotein translocase subunit YajC [Selenomonas sp. oral taxon 126]|uniref:preprotein translocase subunit YajC n=1 Tax=Selenomonas sp. oral taxon 126 TaxID=712528 RepID=UPI0008079A46|nr:preprotein translocase subunit YajC [Selenomonas sp. oral taxon 126]ANR71160.1 preprotein translocase subunit YajC [Selenomonas sp. oral taxon 126]
MDAELMAQLSSWGPIIILVLFFYFLLYRPQKQAQKKRDAMLAALKVGDEIITLGGMHGRITAIDEKTVTLRAADNVNIVFERSAISAVNTEQE